MLEADVNEYPQLRQSVRVAATALLLIAAFAVLSGAAWRGALMALAGAGALAAVRPLQARPIRRRAVPAAA